MEGERRTFRTKGDVGLRLELGLPRGLAFGEPTASPGGGASRGDADFDRAVGLVGPEDVWIAALEPSLRHAIARGVASRGLRLVDGALEAEIDGLELEREGVS